MLPPLAVVVLVVALVRMSRRGVIQAARRGAWLASPIGVAAAVQRDVDAVAQGSHWLFQLQVRGVLRRELPAIVHAVYVRDRQAGELLFGDAF